MTKLSHATVAFGLVLGLTASAYADSNADLFKAKCAMCHGEAGAGKGKVPALTAPEAQKKSDADWKTAIEKGVKNDMGTMPGYSGKLTPEQIDGLVTYIRGLKS